MREFPFWPWPSRRGRKRRPTSRQEQAVARPHLHPARVALAVGTYLLLCILLCVHLWPDRVALSLGDVADREILAPRTVRFEDTDATRRAREEAARSVRKYDTVLDAAGIATENLRARFTAEPTLSALTSDERARALTIADRLVSQTMARSLRDDTDDLKQARQTLRTAPDLNALPAGIRDAVASVASAALVSNLRLNVGETERARLAAERAISPIFRRLSAGQAILKPGERVTLQHLDAFAALGLQSASVDAMTIAMVCALVALLLTFVIAYLRLFHRRIYDNTPQLTLLAILTVISVLGLKIGSTLLGLPVSGLLIGYLAMMCVTSAGMVIAVLIRPSIALLIVSLLSAVSGLILNHELRFTLIALGSSYAGIVACAALRNRTDLLRAALILCGANAVLNALIGQLAGDLPHELLQGMLWGVISGGFALFLYYFGTAAFERLFGVTTHLRLLELSDPATPILQEMRLKVPGTYAHSLMVATLTHAAAEAVGADALLARVAAYYHDLGKMNRPEFFIENQANAENIHDTIAPSLSALILVSHVKEGLEIAAQVGLPPLVCELIAQHHGTSLMRYFYHRATGGVPNEALEAQFRYPGPKPRRKEAAILMLADTVEAASRTLERPTPARIADFVARMIEDKRADGQLDECELTLRDLTVIHEVFTRTLTGTLHARIEYPAGASANYGTSGSSHTGHSAPRPRSGRSVRPGALKPRRKP